MVGRYGSGSKPRIAANGAAPSAVYLLNQAYREIRDLEITNTGASPGDRRGIWIAGRDFGVIRHIHIRNCDVHDGNANGPAFASLVGYRLQAGSPCINKGLLIDGNGGRDSGQALCIPEIPTSGRMNSAQRWANGSRISGEVR